MSTTKKSRVAVLLPLERVSDRDEVIAVTRDEGLLYCVDVATGQQWHGELTTDELGRLDALVAIESRLVADNQARSAS
ncbi:MAG: hypothetical protein ABJE95_27555 [Byssovorax sp.]